MTEREILDRQEQGGQREFYLVRVGMFLRAYGHGAFALSRATGYRVVRQQRKRGVVDVCGFPSAQLELVRQRLQAAGAEVEQGDGDAWLFRGINGTPDDSLVAEDRTGGQTPCATPRTEGLSPCAVTFKIRHTSDYFHATMTPQADGTFAIHSEKPIHGVAPGQFCVVYDNRHYRCYGSGEITV